MLWKQLTFKSRSPIVWLIIFFLLGANLITFFTLFVLLSNPGQASEASGNSPPAASLLPLPSLTTPEPTSIATQVILYRATATKTATPTPTQPPTPTNLPPTAEAAPPTPSQATPPEIERVVIISIDGLRPDALALADTPTLDNLIANGAYSPNAQTVRVSETLPSHASMLSGTIPEKHGILWGLPYIGWPGMNGPTLFNLAHDAGLRTGMIFGKDKLNHLVLPNSVDHLFGTNVHDTAIKKQAIDVIQANMPDVLFIHFPDVDRVGHVYGWMSENQLYAITFTDDLIGEIMAALENEGYLASTLLIITSDHGGHGRRHGDDSPLDRTIPWIAAGPGVPASITLTTPINTYDTAPTVLFALNLPIPENWDGQPILAIFK